MVTLESYMGTSDLIELKAAKLPSHYSTAAISVTATVTVTVTVTWTCLLLLLYE